MNDSGVVETAYEAATVRCSETQKPVSLLWSVM